MIQKGRVKGPFDCMCSPLGLVPKKEEGSFRLIHDLSFPKGDSVNSFIPPIFSSVFYLNIETVINFVQDYGFNCLMCKADIQDNSCKTTFFSKHDHLITLQLTTIM